MDDRKWKIARGCWKPHNICIQSFVARDHMIHLAMIDCSTSYIEDDADIVDSSPYST
jgi:hypothetical protein